MSDLADNNSFEQWQLDGEKDMAARGLEAAKKALEGYEQPSLDPAIEEALAAFIARRESEIPGSFE